MTPAEARAVVDELRGKLDSIGALSDRWIVGKQADEAMALLDTLATAYLASVAVVERLRAALKPMLDLWDEEAPDPDDVDRDVLEPARAALAEAAAKEET